MGGKTENNASQRCGAFYIGISKNHLVEVGFLLELMAGL